jgi:5-methylthioribose kinase
MGIRSFLRRWLGIESVEKTVKKTVKKTVGRAYQQPVRQRRTSVLSDSQYMFRAITLEQFYAKCGGFDGIERMRKTYGDYRNWLSVVSRHPKWRVCLTENTKMITKSFDDKLSAHEFLEKFIAYHERMKAKAAKSGLNYN